MILSRNSMKCAKKKGVDLDKAKETMLDPLYFASMMVKNGKADGEVAGR